ncbi:MAG: hypothetical protein AB8C84_13100 [Oligoflexales bacterium]
MKKLYIMCSTFFIAHCTTSDITPLIQNLEDHYSPSCELHIYDSKEQWPKDAQQLCKIQVKVPLYPWNNTTLSEAMTITKHLACQHGADALYVHDIKGNLLITVATKGGTQTKGRSPLWIKKWLLCKEYQWEWDGQQCNQPTQPALPTDRTRLRGTATPHH